MKNNIKLQMKTRVALLKGLVNVLKDDIDMVYKDVDTFNMFMIDESIREAKETNKRMIDTLKEIEYIIYLYKLKK